MARKLNMSLRAAGIAGTNRSPTVTSIAPNNGVAAGGTAITITGTGFKKSAGPRFTIGGVAVTSVVVTSKTTCTGITGAHAAAGPFPAVCTNAAGGDGGNMTGSGGAFTYT